MLKHIDTLNSKSYLDRMFESDFFNEKNICCDLSSVKLGTHYSLNDIPGVKIQVVCLADNVDIHNRFPLGGNCVISGNGI